MLGGHIDYKLTFQTHVNTLCKKAGQKLNPLAYIIPYIYEVTDENICDITIQLLPICIDVSQSTAESPNKYST